MEPLTQYTYLGLLEAVGPGGPNGQSMNQGPAVRCRPALRRRAKAAEVAGLGSGIRCRGGDPLTKLMKCNKLQL